MNPTHWLPPRNGWRIAAPVAVAASLAVTLSAGPIAASTGHHGAPSYARGADLAAPPRFTPDLAGLHVDAGNTGSYGYAGPTTDGTVTKRVGGGLFLWGAGKSLTAGTGVATDAGLTTGLAVLDPVTLARGASWAPPQGEQLNLTYTAADATGQIFARTATKIYVVKRSDTTPAATLRTIRTIDLTRTLGTNDALLTALPDSRGNVWFTTGRIIGITQPGASNPTSLTLGYVTPAGRTVVKRIAGQTVENGTSVSGRTFYVTTGPSNAGSTRSESGLVLALSANAERDGIDVQWQQRYDAGSSLKPGGFARGGGSSVTLIGHRYLAITDNSDDHAHALIYRQGRSAGSRDRLVCRVPLFRKGQSAVDIAGATAVSKDGTASVVLTNGYNAQRTYAADGIDRRSEMAPGFAKVVVNRSGTKCHVAWSEDYRITTVPKLSTKTGQLYAYVQDEPAAAGDQPAYRFVAISHRTGRITSSAVAGVGNAFTDNFAPITVSPTGSVYQSTPAGLLEWSS